MDNVAHASQKERIQIFSETAARMGTTSAIVEKDFWVCWVLQKMFNTEGLKNKLMFKGGTSLSKVYNVIERFSEKSKRLDFSEKLFALSFSKSILQYYLWEEHTP